MKHPGPRDSKRRPVRAVLLFIVWVLILGVIGWLGSKAFDEDETAVLNKIGSQFGLKVSDYA